MKKKNIETTQEEDWYEVFNLGRRGLSNIDANIMLRIPGHVFLKNYGGEIK